MNTTPELQKFLLMGEELTLIEDNGQWTVDMWKANGIHAWSKTFNEYYQAKEEYDKWK